MDNAGMLAGYVLDQQRRGLCTSTIIQRSYAFARFDCWLADRPLSDACTSDVDAWLDSRSLTPKGRYWHLSTLHGLYVFALRQGWGVTDPTATITRPRMRRYIPRPIADADLGTALSQANSRMLAWLALAAFQGLRCQEIAGLHRNDVLEAERPPLLLVTAGKGGNQRMLPLNRHVEGALRAYGLARSGSMFLRPDGLPYPAARVSALINAHLRHLGIGATAHQLRHWFASHLYARTHDLRLTQEMLGHASPTTTAVYAAYSPSDAASAVRDLAVA